MRTNELAPQVLATASDVSGTIGAQIRRLAQLQPDHAALVPSGCSPLSYRQLRDLVDSTRGALRAAGLRRDARVAISISDSAQAALAIVITSCSGVSIPCNPKQTPDEIEIFFATVRPNALLVLNGEDSAVKRAAERAGIAIIEATQSNKRSLVFSATPIPDVSEESGSDVPAFILQTSGTSAEPKLVPYSHRNMLATAAVLKAWYNLTAKDRCLGVSPVFYAHGLKVTVFTPLLTGGSIAFPIDPSRFDYSEWFSVLKPTWFSAGPTLHRMILDQTESKVDAKTGHSLRFITAGLAAHSPEVLEGLQNTLGVPVLTCYGASEASVISSNQPMPGRSKAGTVGLPWPDTVFIASEDGCPLPPGQRGEILVGGATISSGYLNLPELNRTRFVNGWFKTGDVGSIDQEGFLTVHGRKDDLINRGGEKISPVEIDNVLMRHPAVAEGAAFGVPHPRLGEDVAAAVVLREGKTVRPVELREFLQQHLASFKVPRRIVIRDQLPKGQTGKVVRRQLAEGLVGRVSPETLIAASQVAEEPSIDGDDLVRKISEIWERFLKISPISLDDDFFESGGDSLLAMDVHIELERIIGRTIPTGILLEAPTVRQLAQKLSELNSLRTTNLTRLNTNGSCAPLIFFHADVNGRGYYAATLAKFLRSNQPILVVDAHGMGGGTIPPTIEAMAADRLPQIIRAQPEGPYRLMGTCLGGIVAFEAARMLIASGREVEVVILLDTPTVNARRSAQLFFSIMKRAQPTFGSIVRWTMAWTWFWGAKLQKFCNISWARRSTGFKFIIRRLAAGGSGRVNPVDSSSGPNVEVSLRAATDPPASGYGAYAEAMSNYCPKRVAVPVVYFAIDFNGHPWRQICSDLEIIRLAGTHYDYDFAELARHLRVRL